MKLDLCNFAVVLVMMTPNLARCTELDPSPAAPSHGARTQPEPAPHPKGDLVLRLGNESNVIDHWLGPITYGLRGNYQFTSAWELEAGFIRLHEPGSPSLTSVLDEAQLTVRMPEAKVLSQPIVLGGTLWRNRTIDLYTNVAGLEATRAGALSLNVGLYLGRAILEDVSGAFAGGQLGAGYTSGPVSVTFGYLVGRIGNSTAGKAGLYRRAALEISGDIAPIHSLPMTITLSTEDRFFSFGEGNVSSDPRDALILIAGLEVHLLGG